MDPQVRAFLFGVMGSVALEVVHFFRATSTGRPLARRYSRVHFWVGRILMALTGGILAIAYSVTSDILAIHIGATAPLIIDNLSHRPAEP